MERKRDREWGVERGERERGREFQYNAINVLVREAHTENHTEGSKSDHRSMEQKRRKLSVTKIYLKELQRYLLKLPLLYPFAMTKLLVRELS